MSKMIIKLIKYIGFVLLINTQIILAKDIIGIEVKQQSNIYAGGNACYISSENKLIYINEVMTENDNNTILIYFMEDKSEMLWDAIQEEFNISEILKNVSEDKEENIPAGSVKYGLNVYYNNGEIISVSSFQNPELLKLYKFLDTEGWMLAKRFIPKSIEAKDIVLFKLNAISISDCTVIVFA